MNELPLDQLTANLVRAKKELNLLMFHVETVKSLIKIKESKIYSKLVSPKTNEKILLSGSLSTEENLKIRYEYFKICEEAIFLEDEIEAKTKLISQYEAHVARTIEEGPKPISDSQMDKILKELRELQLKGKVKEQAIQMEINYRAGNITGLQNRFDFFEGVKNFIKQNS